MRNTHHFDVASPPHFQCRSQQSHRRLTTVKPFLCVCVGGGADVLYSSVLSGEDEQAWEKKRLDNERSDAGWRPCSSKSLHGCGWPAE